ncbi:MAG: hypothetical protein LBU06_07090 [Desulfovibrio sp.]|jgi:epoxyqueuosine reductase QueG|nr:hypothetical protein [Desulfovibrio sp.]
MSSLSDLRPELDGLVSGHGETIIYGLSDLGSVLPSALEKTPRAVSFAVRMGDELMDSVREGPHSRYLAEYTRVNALINEIAGKMTELFRLSGCAARYIHSSQRVDEVNIAGEFPHKTAAVFAGLGWIGRNCQLVTRAFGPRVRLGTVLTDMALGEEAPNHLRFHCGSCRRCVDACPASALTGGDWTEGVERSVLLNAKRCDEWKKEHYAAFSGNVCGICTSACPQGSARRKERKSPR